MFPFLCQFDVFSTIQTVIVSQGDVSDFHHLQGDLVILMPSETGMSVFFSHHPRKNSSPNYLLFFGKH